MKIYTNTSTEFYNPLFPKKTLEGKQKKTNKKQKTVERQKTKFDWKLWKEVFRYLML